MATGDEKLIAKGKAIAKQNIDVMQSGAAHMGEGPEQVRRGMARRYAEQVAEGVRTPGKNYYAK